LVGGGGWAYLHSSERKDWVGSQARKGGKKNQSGPKASKSRKRYMAHHYRREELKNSIETR